MAEPPSTARSVNVDRLARLVVLVEGQGPRALSDEQVVELPRLYRRVSDELAQERSSPDGRRRADQLGGLLARAHGILYAKFEGAGPALPLRMLRFLLGTSPRTIRAEWKLGLGLLVCFYALSLTAFAVVRKDLDMAFVLQDPAAVNAEIEQLRATSEGQPFRGNFTFGLGDSPQTAGWILAHNIGVSLLFFASALIPPLFLLMLGVNALMLGTYTAVAGHWGQAGSISSILWCHGTIELQMIVLAGMAGLVLVRGWIAPGPWSRAHAMTLEGRRAWALLAPTIPFLFLSGLIEGYVSPHAPLGVRLAVAIGTGTLLVLWITLGGRSPGHEAPSFPASSDSSVSAPSASPRLTSGPRN